MKIVEDSPNRLVLKEGALVTRIVGIIMIVAGIGVAIAGSQVKKNGAALYVFGAVFAVAGALMLVFTKSDTVVADKTSRQLTVTFKSLKNRSGQNQTYPFDNVASVQLLQQYQQYYDNTNNMNSGSGFTIGGGNTQTMLKLNLAVMLKDGTTVTIANEQKQAGLALGVSSNSLVDRGQKLAAALGVPFQQSGAATPGQVVQAIEHKLTGQPESFAGPGPSTPTASVSPVTPNPVAAEPGGSSGQTTTESPASPQARPPAGPEA